MQKPTRAILENRARMDYKAVEGRVIRYTGAIECFRDGDNCGPVAVTGALLFVLPGNMFGIRRWTDDTNLGPTWPVLFHPSPPREFANDSGWFIYAPSYSLDKDVPVDHVDYTLIEESPGYDTYVVVGFYEHDRSRFCEKVVADNASAAENAVLADNPELTIVEAIGIPDYVVVLGNTARRHLLTQDDHQQTCEHEPDWLSVLQTDEQKDVFDVTCRKCGLSGAFHVTPEQVDW